MYKAKPIPTVWNGVQFRSRLEARWAMAMDNYGIEWFYEPEGFELAHGLKYVPDFWLPQVNMWAEVKPVELNETEERKARGLVDATGYPCILLVGLPGDFGYRTLQPDSEWPEIELCPFHPNQYHRTERRFYWVADYDIRGFSNRACAAANKYRFDSKRRRGRS
jgi:hypothetical protein